MYICYDVTECSNLDCKVCLLTSLEVVFNSVYIFTLSHLISPLCHKKVKTVFSWLTLNKYKVNIVQVRHF